jgi:DNA primase
MIIDNIVINEPIINILYKLKELLKNEKLKDIRIYDNEIVVTCPNNNHKGGKEHNPDCHISLEKDKYGVFHCFGCGISGNFIRFISYCFNSSYEYAKNWLSKTYNNKQQIFTPIEIKNNIDIKLDESILDNYSNWTSYLEKRKLNREVCEKFNVKYDSIKRQIIFPIYDINNNLKMLAKRNIDNKFFYMTSGQEKEVYGLNYIKKNNIKKCMLVEGPIDLLTCYCHNIPAIATLGTPSNYQINLINKVGLNYIFIATDNDMMGNKFADLLNQKLNYSILRKRIQLPKGVKDVNDLSEEQWNDLIKKYNL